MRTLSLPWMLTGHFLRALGQLSSLKPKEGNSHVAGKEPGILFMLPPLSLKAPRKRSPEIQGTVPDSNPVHMISRNSSFPHIFYYYRKIGTAWTDWLTVLANLSE